MRLEIAAQDSDIVIDPGTGCRRPEPMRKRIRHRPDFPTLKHFLDYWEREIEGPLHSVRVAHHRLIQPSEWRAVDGVVTLQ